MNPSSKFFDSEEIFDFLFMRLEHSELYLAHCGIQQCTPGYFYGPGERPEYHLHIVLNGHGEFHMQGRTRYLTRGDSFLVPANETVFYKASDTDPWHYCWVAFSGSLADQIVGLTNYSEFDFVRPLDTSLEEFAALIYEILHASQLAYANELMRTGYLYQILALLIGSFQNGSSPPKENASDVYIEHALQYIHLAYHRDLKVQDIVDYLGISRSYFVECFHAKLNMSPKKYLMNVRMRTASRLLSETTLPISEIGQRVGYQDPFIFSKAFKKVTGESPRSYRISHPDKKIL